MENSSYKNKDIEKKCLHNLYDPEPIRQIVGDFIDKVVSLFKTSTPKIYSKKRYMGEERNKANQKHKNNPNET